MARQQYQVCHSCMDGPRCTDIYLYKQVLEVEDGSPGARTTRTAHSAIQISVSSVQLYGMSNPGLAHPEGGERCKIIEEEFNTNVSDLIEKWEEAGGGGSKLEVEEGGRNIARRTSAEFRSRQAIFETCQEAEYPVISCSKTLEKYSPTFQSFQNANIRKQNPNYYIESDSLTISHTEVWGRTPLAETRANRKRGREEDSDSCETKKPRPSTG